MFTDDLPGVDVFARGNEEAAARLQVVQRVSEGVAGLHGDDGAVLAALDVALPRLKLEEAVGHDSLPGRKRQHEVVEADDAA